jgi:hydroxyacylglutathione hydrolase
LNREPGNLAAQQLLSQVSGQDVNQPYVSSMATEREVNTFFRLDSEQVVAELRKSFPDIPDQADAQTVFKKLRELRNSW